MNRLLLDTHVLLWLTDDAPRLKRRPRQLIENADAVYFSAVSIFEVATKTRLGKMNRDAAELAFIADRDGLIELPVSAVHAAAVGSLPLHHADPFDRLLVAQAISEPLTLLTADRALAAYGPHVVVI